MASTSTIIEFGTATTLVADVVGRIRDEQLGDPTPCQGLTVAQLLDHLDGLCQAFTHAAVKSTALNAPPGQPDGARLGPDWRSRIPARLAQLAEAWLDPAAWTGTSAAGGVELPAPMTGRVAINEVVVHGWDLARATGQRYEPDGPELVAAGEFVEWKVAQSPEGSSGIFGPPVEVPAGASPVDRLIAATGRNPAWRRDR